MESEDGSKEKGPTAERQSGLILVWIGKLVADAGGGYESLR